MYTIIFTGESSGFAYPFPDVALIDFMVKSPGTEWTISARYLHLLTALFEHASLNVTEQIQENGKFENAGALASWWRNHLELNRDEFYKSVIGIAELRLVNLQYCNALVTDGAI